MTAPVGVFDSGVGGLSVLREIRSALPQEDLAYVADSGFAPYGNRPREFIEARATAVARFLIGEGAKALVVACNTATGVAVQALRARFSLPIVAMEPAVKPAASSTKSGVVGVLATSQTLSSANFQRLVATHANGVRILVQPCSGLVEQVENGDLSGAATRALVEQYVAPLLDKGVDTLVLGCTHYPFLRALIEEAAGPGVSVIDPAVAVARELRRRLQASDLLAPGSASEGSERFWTSGATDKVRAVMAQLWRPDVEVHALPNAYCSEYPDAPRRAGN